MTAQPSKYRKWIFAGVVTGLTGLACLVLFAVGMARNLRVPVAGPAPEVARLLDEPLPPGRAMLYPRADARATTATNTAEANGPEGDSSLIPSDRERSIERHQRLTKNYHRWCEEHGDSLTLNTEAVPLDLDKPLLPVKEEYDEEQRALVAEINASFASMQRNLRLFFEATGRDGSFDELYALLQDVRAGSMHIDSAAQRLTTAPSENRIVDGEVHRVSLITDIYTMEQCMVLAGESQRFTRNMIVRLAHDHERWEAMLWYVPWNEQLGYIQRMRGTKKYVHLADWTLENDIQRPLKNWTAALFSTSRQPVAEVEQQPTADGAAP
jgi:hypothetical protein